MGAIRQYWRRTGRYWLLALLLHLAFVGLLALLRVPLPAPPEKPCFVVVEFVEKPALPSDAAPDTEPRQP